jgi:membrane protease subunit (stomatin/prohibitin family)
MAVPRGLTSPLRAEVYMVNMKVFPNLKWGTRDPVAFKDSELGLIRLRAFGMFNIRVVQPLLFINALLGTLAGMNTSNIEEYLGKVIVSRLNDYLGEHLESVLDLPGNYQSISTGLKQQLEKDFSRFGLALSGMYINSITPPPEVQKAIDDRSQLGVIDDLDGLAKLKAAMSMEKAAENQAGAGEGMGAGMGFMMPAMMARYFLDQPSGPAAGSRQSSSQTCPDCKQRIPEDAAFCPLCGHQIMIIDQCAKCGKNLAPNARFCSRCGTPVQQRTEHKDRFCANCGAQNLDNSVFCNQCGERLST